MSTPIQPAAGASARNASYRVQGRITSPDRSAVGVLEVRLYQRLVGGDLLAGEARCSPGGQYGLKVPDAALRLDLDALPDWVVVASHAGKTLAASALHCDAARSVVIDLQIPAGTKGLPAEFSTLRAMAAPLKMAETPADGLRPAGAPGTRSAPAASARTPSGPHAGVSQDAEYIASKTGWPKETVQAQLSAAQLAAQTDGKVAEPLLYAVLRRGGFQDMPNVFRQAPQELQTQWREAADQGWIDEPTAEETEGALAHLRELNVQSRLSEPRFGAVAPMAQWLAHAKLDEEGVRRYAELVVDHRGTNDDFWAAARKTFGARTVPRLRKLQALADLTQDNPVLVKRLSAKGDTQALALQGLVKPSNWQRLLADAPLPADLDATDESGRRSQYAERLANRLREQHPTAALVHLLRCRELPLEHADEVASLLERHLDRFDLTREPAAALASRAAQTIRPELLQQTKRLQRVRQMAPTDQAMAGLLEPEAGLDSAWRVSRLSQKAFVSEHADRLGGEEAARTVHARATQIHATALNVAMTYLTARQSPALGLTDTVADTISTAKETSPARSKAPAARAESSGVAVYPTLEQLLGSMDYVAADPSRSVLSPAAYLVDLLDFMADVPVRPNPNVTVLDEFLRRRPDVEHLLLNAENTNVALPYIDLVNEVLEYFVAQGDVSGSSAPLAGFTGHNTGPVSSEDLRAGPQNSNSAAYAALESAWFPPPLPLHQPLEAMRRHFAALGQPLVRVMEALRPTDELERDEVKPFGWRDILAEELEISRPEYRTFTDASLSIQDLFGFDPATPLQDVLSELSNAKKFCRRLGISYEDLVNLLGTRFVNPAVQLLPKLDRLNVPIATLQALVTGALSEADFQALLPTGSHAPDPKHYAGDIPTWIRTHFGELASLLTLTRVAPSTESDFSSYEIACAVNPHVVNASFEWPDLRGGYEYAGNLHAHTSPDVLGWTFVANAGIQGTGSAWHAEAAPSGRQTAFLQTLGQMSQAIALNAGVHLLTFQIARRIDNIPANSAQPIRISLDGRQIGELATPASTAFETWRVNFTVATSGIYTLKLEGTDAEGDKSSFIEAIAITRRADPSVFVRLLRFIRLWKKTGWTIEQADVALCTLFTADLSPLALHHVDQRHTLDQGFSTVLPRLAVVKRTLVSLKLSVDEGLQPLLACWGPLNTHGNGALYRQLFLNQTIARIDTAFAEDAYGDALTDGTALLVDHAEALCAALSIDRSDLDRILQGMRPAGDRLTLATLSSCFRHAWMARSLGLSVQDFLLLLSVLTPATLPNDAGPTNWHPFDAPDAGTAPVQTPDRFDVLRPDEPPITRFIDWVQCLQASSLSIQEIVARVWNRDADGLPQRQFVEAEFAELARSLRADFVAIDQPFIKAGQATEDTLTERIDQVLGSGVGAQFLDRLLNRQGLEVPCTLTEAAISPSLQKAVPGLVYDDTRKRLQHAGRLSVQQLIDVTEHPDASDALKDSTRALFEQGNVDVGLFFCRYPDLQPVFDASFADETPTAKEWDALLGRLATHLTEKPKRDAALKRLAAFAGTDLQMTRDLLDPVDPAAQGVYPLSGPDLYSPALVYALSLDRRGLRREIFYSDSAAGSPASWSWDAQAPDYDARDGRPLPGNPAAPSDPIAGRWSGWIEVPETSDGRLSFLIAARPDARIALSLDDQPHDLSMTGGFARIDLAGLPSGRLIAFSLTAENVRDRLSLTWQTTAQARQSIPLHYLYAAGGSIWSLGYMMLRFQNALYLARALRLSGRELAWLTTRADQCFLLPSGGSLGWLNFLPNYFGGGWETINVARQLPSRLRTLIEYSRLKARWSDRSGRLLDWLKSVENKAPSFETLISTLSGHTPETVRAIATQIGCSSGELCGIAALSRIEEALTTVGALKLPIPDLIRLVTNDPTPEQASKLVSIARARFSETAWREHLRPINDEMRTLQRDALIAQVLQQFHHQPDRTHIDTADKLFEYFLVDVQMSAHTETSRIRQALSSVQLFIERCLLNLEPQLAGVFDSEHKERWTWMKRYRMWEAQRKVFLYPENWLEPELRDQKSAQFRSLENQLLQSDISDSAAKTALVGYLRDLQEISRLEICGMFVDGPSTGTSDKEVDDIHIVSRTLGGHQKYYHTLFENGRWNPWEPIDVDIEDAPVIPFKRDGRLLLFWLKVIRLAGSSTSTATAATTASILPKNSTPRMLPTEPPEPTNPPFDDTDDTTGSDGNAGTGSNTGTPEGSTTGEKSLISMTASELMQYSGSIAATAQKNTVGGILCWSERVKDKWDRVRSTDLNQPVFLSEGTPAALSEFRRSNINLHVDPESWLNPTNFRISVDHKRHGWTFHSINSMPPDQSYGPYAQIAYTKREVNPKNTLSFNYRCSIDLGPLFGAHSFSHSRTIAKAHTRGRSIDMLMFDIPTQLRLQSGLPYFNAPFIYQDPNYEFVIFPKVGKFGTEFTLPDITYTFLNIFHPYIDAAIKQMNEAGLAGIYNGTWQCSLNETFFEEVYGKPDAGSVVRTFQKKLATTPEQPYSNYNWELLYHAPLLVAAHLNKTRRFSEAQRWLHFIFDPTSTDDASGVDRYWNFLAFRINSGEKPSDDDLASLFSTPSEELDTMQRIAKTRISAGYREVLSDPFNPHAVARIRQLAYRNSVVMKYLDNLLAWGDDLFRQDSMESINEATQIYVLASNILGPRPQRVPPAGTTQGHSYADIKANRDPMGNALVDLENVFPFAQNPAGAAGNRPLAGALLGLGRTLYFNVPYNEKLLTYWDQVADRLFKVRHGMNLAGVVRALALFDSPIDPGALVAAAGAGFDVQSILAGLQPTTGTLRGLALLHRAMELCAEVKSLGAALLAAIEKGDSEQLSLARQAHEITLQNMVRETRFLQWKSSEESTNALLTSRATTLQRLRFYQRLLDLPGDPNAQDLDEISRPEMLTEKNFKEILGQLVTQYDKPLTLQELPPLRRSSGKSALFSSGVESPGRLFLNNNEHLDLNVLTPDAQGLRLAAQANDIGSKLLPLVPDVDVDLHYLGLGMHSKVFGGSMLSTAAQIITSSINAAASAMEAHAANASKTASYERRADEWVNQYNQAAQEVRQNGRQIISSILSEQVAKHEYEMAQQQALNASEIGELMEGKFSNRELYTWMQGEVSRLYYDYYRFAFETARRAEYALKQELMRADFDRQTFVRFNYWDTGRKGLLSGESLALDLKRLEATYHEHNQRELEITKHVSLRQLDPSQLILLREQGKCSIEIPDELFALDFPSHCCRRIRSVSISIPCVAGPFTSVSGTLTLTAGKLRRRIEAELEAVGPLGERAIATSSANNDSGVFELNFKDDRYLPFEGAGAASSWEFKLPGEFRSFDYSTIADLVLHVRYTARNDSGSTASATGTARVESWLKSKTNGGALFLLISLRQDFPDVWALMTSGTAPLPIKAKLTSEFLPYFVRSRVADGATVKFGAPLAVSTSVKQGEPVELAVTAQSNELTIELPQPTETERIKDLLVVVPYSLP